MAGGCAFIKGNIQINQQQASNGVITSHNAMGAAN
jgi:hypothetical protein